MDVRKNIYLFLCEFLGRNIIYDMESLPAYFQYKNTILESVEIPKNIKYIEKHAFQDCTALTSVHIPESVIGINDDAFRNCINLTSIQYDGTKAQFRRLNKGQYWHRRCGIGEVHCSDGVVKY